MEGIKNATKGKEIAKKNGYTFKKAELLDSGRYFDRVDLLHVLLEDEKEYTIREVDEQIAAFMKRRTK